MKQKPYRGKYRTRKKHLPLWLWVIPSSLLVIGLCAVGMILLNRYNARSDYQEMAAMVREPQVTFLQTTEAAEIESSVSVLTTEPLVTTETVAEPTVPLAQYQQLSQENPDMVGWLRIDNTVIDYPVMHTPEYPEKYLRRNFQGKYSYGGVPFVDYRCKEDSDNLLIYGHNMKDGSMFRTLMSYREQSYWKDYPVIRFDSLYKEREYQVVAAFYDRVYYTYETNFKFYDFIDAADEAEYNRAVEIFRKKSLYDTGVIPKYGQQLITLVTCTDQVENGRFVVVACEKTE